MPEGLVDQEDPASATMEAFMGSYTADPGEAPTLAGSGIIGYGGAGSVPTDGLWNFRDDEEWISQVDGYMGSDVTGVTVAPPPAPTSRRPWPTAGSQPGGHRPSPVARTPT